MVSNGSKREAVVVNAYMDTIYRTSANVYD